MAKALDVTYPLLLSQLKFKKQVKVILLADANKEPISLQTICILCAKLEHVKMQTLNNGQLSIFGRYQNQLKELRNKILNNLYHEENAVLDNLKN